MPRILLSLPLILLACSEPPPEPAPTPDWLAEDAAAQAEFEAESERLLEELKRAGQGQ